MEITYETWNWVCPKCMFPNWQDWAPRIIETCGHCFQPIELKDRADAEDAE